MAIAWQSLSKKICKKRSKQKPRQFIDSWVWTRSSKCLLLLLFLKISFWRPQSDQLARNCQLTKQHRSRSGISTDSLKTLFQHLCYLNNKGVCVCVCACVFFLSGHTAGPTELKFGMDDQIYPRVVIGYILFWYPGSVQPKSCISVKIS